METISCVKVTCVFGKNIEKGKVFWDQTTTTYSYSLRFRFVFNFHAFENILFVTKQVMNP